MKLIREVTPRAIFTLHESGTPFVISVAVNHETKNNINKASGLQGFAAQGEEAQLDHFE